MKETEFKEKRKAFNELKKKFENEFKEIKKEFKMPFKDIKSELKGEFKDFKKQQKEYEDYQKKLEELEQRVKDLILELKENFAYDQEHKAELKKELKTSLYKEKRALDKHEKQEKHKIDSKISSLSKSSDPQRDAKKYGFDFKNGKIKIAIKLSDVDPTVIENIENLGTVTVKNDKHIQMIVDVDDIPKIRSLEGIEKIRPPFSAIQFEQTVSEGVYFINADLVQYAGITGKGIKVAVLDLAFTNNPKISDNIVEVKSFREGLDFIPLQGNEGEAGHGTAVAEIITDVAPEVELYLYAIETDIEFTAAIDEAISKDVDIIAMSAGWPHFPTDGTSHITKKIEEAIANDITFVVPAGNFGDKHWEGTFVDSNLNGWQEFLDTDEGLSFNVTESRIAEQKPITANLLWDVGMSDVADFDLVLVDPLGQIVDYSANEQITKDDSQFEYIYHVPEIEGIYALGVVYAGDTNTLADIPDATIEIFTINDPLEHPIVFSSVSVPADADGAIVVGAVNHMDGELEPFSSQGPTNHGKLAPHVVGPDGVTTTALDGEAFFGTSATTPYIAGMAALLLEINPDITPDQLLTEIQQNTVSNLVSLQTEYDNAMGYGQANAEFLTQMEVVS
jgi:subtilisin family serine protease